ncbi:hypothetical protein, partial [Nocardiopsis gilva]|uniref:hypothetical protein n=1 Tax=Nocardiopsis gilva TaxID=280236 RepID=UPI0019D32BD1
DQRKDRTESAFPLPDAGPGPSRLRADRGAPAPTALGAAFHPRTPDRATADKAAQQTPDSAPR